MRVEFTDKFTNMDYLRAVHGDDVVLPKIKGTIVGLGTIAADNVPNFIVLLDEVLWTANMRLKISVVIAKEEDFVRLPI
jgi:hypothetical protein